MTGKTATPAMPIIPDPSRHPCLAAASPTERACVASVRAAEMPRLARRGVPHFLAWKSAVSPDPPPLTVSLAGEPQVRRHDAPGADVNGRIITVGELTDHDEFRWRTLAERAGQPNPLSEPDCVVPAAEHLKNGPAILLVLAEEDEYLFGCLPVQRFGRWRGLRRPVLSSEVRRMQYDGTPLLDRDRGRDAIRAMLVALGQRLGRPRRWAGGL